MININLGTSPSITLRARRSDDVEIICMVLFGADCKVSDMLSYQTALHINDEGGENKRGRGEEGQNEGLKTRPSLENGTVEQVNS